MNKYAKDKRIIGVIIFLILLLIDLITKSIFFSEINPGSMYSILKNNNFWILISIIALIVLVLNRTKIKNNLIFVFITTGILGNLIDRIFYGGVRDFIRLNNYFFFNLADSYIVIGVIVILLREFKFEKKRA